MNSTTGSINTTGVFAAINREIALLKSRYQAKVARNLDEEDCDCCGHPCAGTDCHACCEEMLGNWVCDSCELTHCGDECLPIHWRTTPGSRDYTYCSSCDEIRLSYGQVNYHTANTAILCSVHTAALDDSDSEEAVRASGTTVNG